MNAIIILLSLQTVWMIWRDLDCRKYQMDLKSLREHHDADRNVLINNHRNACHEAEYWQRMYTQTLTKDQPKPAGDAE